MGLKTRRFPISAFNVIVYLKETGCHVNAMKVYRAHGVIGNCGFLGVYVKC
jgi:hypothetical protein